MVEIRGRFVYPEGLTPGQSQEGGLSQLLYNSEGHLADHGTFYPDDISSEDFANMPAGDPPDSWPAANTYVVDEEVAEQLDELTELLAALVILGIIATVQAVTPHVQRWWTDVVVPAIKSTTKRARSAWNNIPLPPRRGRNVAVPELTPLNDFTSGDVSTGVDEVLEELRVGMSSEEARERFVAALMAKEFFDEQVRLLSHARIDDSVGSWALTGTMESLTPKQVGTTILRMLEEDPSLLNRQTLSEVRNLLPDGLGDQVRVPIRSTNLKEVLGLMQGGA